MANRTKTPTTAAKGTAIIKPKKPNKTPPANKANITHTGCNPIESPTNFGVKKFPSKNCPKTNTPTTCAIGTQLSN